MKRLRIVTMTVVSLLLFLSSSISSSAATISISNSFSESTKIGSRNLTFDSTIDFSDGGVSDSDGQAIFTLIDRNGNTPVGKSFIRKITGSEWYFASSNGGKLEISDILFENVTPGNYRLETALYNGDGPPIAVDSFSFQIRNIAYKDTVELNKDLLEIADIKQVEDLKAPPENVVVKSNAYTIKTINPQIENEEKIVFTIDKTLLENVDPYKVSIWKFTSTESTEASQVRTLNSKISNFNAINSNKLNTNTLNSISSNSNTVNGYWEPIGGKVDLASSKVTGHISESGTYAVMLSKQSYPDIKGNKYQYEIEVLLAQGIISGYNGKEFRPNSPITRAQMSKIITKTAHLKLEKSNGSLYKDIPSSHWAALYITATTKAKLFQGYPGDLFKPDSYITRQQAATVGQRTGKVDTLSISKVNQIINNLADKASISPSHKKNVAEMIANHMMPIGSDKRFYPTKPALRADVARMIMPLMKRLGYL